MLTKTDNSELVLGCERRIINAWPALSTLIVGDWVLRFANGYSGRGNSATPLSYGAELDATMLDLIEELYRADGLVPAGWWQSATSLGAWTLVGCTVAPGFEFKGFEMASPGWRPTPRKPSGG